MGTLTVTEKRALEYLNNAVQIQEYGQEVLPIEIFDDANSPIGPDLREQLVDKGHIIEVYNMIVLIRGK